MKNQLLQYTQWPLAEESVRYFGYVDVERHNIKILVLGGKGHQVDKNVEWIECHRIKTRQDGGPRLISFGTCGRTGASEDDIVLLKIQTVIDPVSKEPRTLQTASLDESQRTETLTRTSFWPEQFRSRQELSIDVLSVMDELFNEEVPDATQESQGATARK